MESFPPSNGKLCFLLVVDYMSKSIEAIATPKNDSNTMVNFFKKHILTWFRAPRATMSDEGSHFNNRVFEKLITRYRI